MGLQHDESTNCCIRSYETGQLELHNKDVISSSVVIQASQALSSWPVSDARQLTLADFQTIIEHKPAVLLLGTGESHVMLAPDIMTALQSHHIGVECMTTQAACRCFVALTAEGRDAWAALIIP